MTYLSTPYDSHCFDLTRCHCCCSYITRHTSHTTPETSLFAARATKMKSHQWLFISICTCLLLHLTSAQATYSNPSLPSRRDFEDPKEDWDGTCFGLENVCECHGTDGIYGTTKRPRYYYEARNWMYRWPGTYYEGKIVWSRFCLTLAFPLLSVQNRPY